MYLLSYAFCGKVTSPVLRSFINVPSELRFLLKIEVSCATFFVENSHLWIVEYSEIHQSL